MSAPCWIVMPFLNCWEMTQAAVQDCLDQIDLPSPPQILLIDTGSTREVRSEVEAWMEKEPRLHAWFHRPGLPSLSATWNLGLRFVWTQGGEVALVVNNDTRLHRQTYSTLLGAFVDVRHPLFVSAVGRREADMDWEAYFAAPAPSVNHEVLGGPDFSCFVISRAGHAGYPFDEGFIPAYGEDCSCHREYMLGGDGERIFSVNLPYLHYGSATINADPSKRAHWARRLEQSRAYYRACWGGDVNYERFTIKGDPSTEQGGVTNPELQARILGAATVGDQAVAPAAHDSD